MVLTAQNPMDRFKEMSKQYAEGEKNRTFNALVYGQIGTGKTLLSTTCRKPVLFHSFDPGGTTTIRKHIATGDIIPDTRFEVDDTKSPSAFMLWEKEIELLQKQNAFTQIGTLYLDSITTWFDTMLRAILLKQGRVDMQIKDWGIALTTAKNYINLLANLPCDFITTGHIGINKDEVTGKNETSLLLPGSSKEKLFMYFDEVYVALTQKRAKGETYKLLTGNDGYYKARTRLGEGGLLDRYEDPSIKGILKKVGLPTDDICIPTEDKKI